MNTYNGYQVYQSISVPEFKEVHRQERKWARRVMHQRYRRFDVRLERFVFMFNGQMHMHPNTWAIIKLAASCNSNTGV